MIILIAVLQNCHILVSTTYERLLTAIVVQNAVAYWHVMLLGFYYIFKDNFKLLFN